MTAGQGRQRHATGTTRLVQGALDRYPRVYPREVVKRALELHAGAVVLAHNHPSGAAEPSRAHELLTQTLKSKWQAWHLFLNDKESVMRSMGC